VRYVGLEHIDRTAPQVFIANHQSMADIWALLAVLPPSSRFVAKRELFRIPIFGWALAAAGFVPIERSKHSGALRSLDVAAERIRQGHSLVLFPEGTRTRDGRLRPFKKGAFHLALRAGVPVVPVAISGSFELLPPRTLRVHPGPVHVRFEPPLDVAPFQPTDHAGLLEAVRATIARRLEPAS
jgi:1-acyl-sn-glycerol-3-phosphate acyltransferase